MVPEKVDVVVLTNGIKDRNRLGSVGRNALDALAGGQ